MLCPMAVRIPSFDTRGLAFSSARRHYENYPAMVSMISCISRLFLEVASGFKICRYGSVLDSPPVIGRDYLGPLRLILGKM